MSFIETPLQTQIESAFHRTGSLKDYVFDVQHVRPKYLLEVTEAIAEKVPENLTLVSSSFNERIYPHLYDEEEPSGKAIRVLKTARSELDKALEAYSVPDLEEVRMRLTLVSTAALKSSELFGLNPDFQAVVEFIRRAALIADVTLLTRPALNCLSNCISYIIDNPTLDLMESARIANELSDAGWDGEQGTVGPLLQAVLNESDVEMSEQKELFGLLSRAL